jgi:beta-fructofuranosidase
MSQGDYPISSLKWTNPDHDGFWFQASGGNLGLQIFTNSGPNPALSSVPISYGIWYFVAGTWSRNAGAVSLYLNGELKKTAAFTYFDTFPSDVDIGRYNYQDNYNFYGLIDDVRIYNRALSAAEIQAIYNATK